jgi:hypothetical protein
VIGESRPWKNDLLVNARLLKRITSKRRSARRSFEFERTLFVSAYVMRKLWEAGKLSSSWKQRGVPCVLHPPKNRSPDLLNWHRLDELYELDISKRETISALEFCHRLVHSFIFVEVEGPRQALVGFFFASDRSKLRGLCYVELSDVLALLSETSRDYPSSVRMARHLKTNQWMIWSGHGDPPDEWMKRQEAISKELAVKEASRE